MKQGDGASNAPQERSMSVDERTWLSLDGLSVGDAFGENFFGRPRTALRWMMTREAPPAPWHYTDDTEMALSIVEVLHQYGRINQDALAAAFARRMEDHRGYGQGAYSLLCGVREGANWRGLTRASFGGRGSFGNGAAMRVAPLGAFFADQPLARIVEQAGLSAEVTHAHPEGMAGAMAVAVAAALAWRQRDDRAPLGADWIQAVRDAVPAGYTREAISDALDIPEQTSISEAAEILGNGSEVTAPDTVPLCLWIAARQSNDFEESLWETVSALGDIDTTCAIVGGIVALKSGRAAIPRSWLAAREPLPLTPPSGA